MGVCDGARLGGGGARSGSRGWGEGSPVDPGSGSLSQRWIQPQVEPGSGSLDCSGYRCCRGGVGVSSGARVWGPESVMETGRAGVGLFLLLVAGMGL